MISNDPPDYRIGGAGWARMGLPARCLKELGGIETGVFRRWGFNAKSMQFEMQHEDGRIEGDWDIVIFQRWMYKEAPRFFRAAKQSGQVCLNDLDDHYWGLATTNQAFYTSHPKANPDENRDHYWKCLGESDLITVSTPFLAEKVKRLGVPVMHLPNMIDMSLFNKRPVEGGNKDLTVGWVGGVPWRSGDLETLKGVLDPFLQRHDCVFYHGGAWPNGAQANEMIGVPDERYFSRPIVAIEDYPALMDPIDIGIAPLNDIPFNRAKCLDASTRIATVRGFVPIGEIKEGDEVYDGEGNPKCVLATSQEPRSSGFRITTNYGNQLILTGTHRLWNGEGWVQARNIRVGTELSTTFEEHQIWKHCAATREKLQPFQVVTKVEPCEVDPIDIQVEGEVFSAAGFRSHNSAIKTMEYSAAGIPFVAAAMPEYLSYAPEFCAKRPKDWTRMLSKLLDPEERQRQQDINYERVKKQDIHVRYTDWLKIIDFASDVRSKRAIKTVADNKRLETALARLTDKSLEQIAQEEMEHQQSLPPAANATAILDRALTMGGVKAVKR